MLNWAIAFLIVALIAGLFGFGIVEEPHSPPRRPYLWLPCSRSLFGVSLALLDAKRLNRTRPLQWICWRRGTRSFFHTMEQNGPSRVFLA
jgi:hypothetical protein